MSDTVDPQNGGESEGILTKIGDVGSYLSSDGRPAKFLYQLACVTLLYMCMGMITECVCTHKSSEGISTVIMMYLLITS